MSLEAKFNQELQKECLDLLTKCRIKLMECRIVAHHYPEKRQEMVENGTKIIRHACTVLELSELIK